MTLERSELIYEGKAKKVFRTDSPDKVLIEFKNDATAFNALKHSEFEGKGGLNCQISARLFEFLESKGIPTHYLGLQSDTSMCAQTVRIIPLEVVIRNIATGSLCKQAPIAEGTKISPPLLDIYYKDDDFGDPLLSEARLELLNLVTNQERIEIERLSRKVNELLTPFFEKLDLLLVDFKLEIGVNSLGQLLIADEISPDTCRIWDKRVASSSNERILDKDRFRKDLGGLIDAYCEIFKRVQKITSNPRVYS